MPRTMAWPDGGRHASHVGGRTLRAALIRTIARFAWEYSVRSGVLDITKHARAGGRLGLVRSQKSRLLL
jgi:hypothetical protein